MKRIRFFGAQRAMLMWRRVVTDLTGKEGSVIREHKDSLGFSRYYFDVELSNADLIMITELVWYKPSGLCQTSDGKSFPWNYCVSFTEVKRKV